MPSTAPQSAMSSQPRTREPLHGVGLGLRRSMLPELAGRDDRLDVDFFEIAPENWIGVGGIYGRRLHELTGRYPFVNHGLSLSIGGPGPLDREFLGRLRRFLDQHRVLCYSEHLSYCSDDGHLYDLMPIPFTGEAVRHVAARIRRVQEIMGQRCVMCHGENGLSRMPGTPSLAGQSDIYLVSQLQQVRNGKRHNEVMNVIAKPMSDADIDNVSAWFAQFEVELKKK
jgi:cytochrome c553